MKERLLTCIVCPKGCEMKVMLDECGNVVAVEGNTCKRGIVYAENECVHPTRTVTSTVRTESGKMLPVKTAAPIPKELIFEAMKKINLAVAKDNAVIGDTVIEDILGTGIAVVVTANARDCE